jgi:hypothetical protein
MQGQSVESYPHDLLRVRAVLKTQNLEIVALTEA